MKRRYLLLTCLFVWMGIIETFGQQYAPATQSLIWEVNELTDTVYQATSTYSCQFESLPGNKIIWTQSHLVSELTVTDISGNWADTSMDGSILFSTMFNGKPCTVRFSRTNGSAQIRVNLVEDGRPSFPVIFHVTSIQPKQ